MFDEDLDIFKDTSALPIERSTTIKIEPKKTFVTDTQIIDRTRHEAAVPIDTTYNKIKIRDEFPHKKYEFELDTFQKLALTALHLNHSVLVSAHTSAGKTVVAEYAIAMSLINKQRVIYTSPIKALSNQKYRELQELYADVGLITGDVTLNPNASCLVMTTEILRNMLYRGSEIMREVKWIVFDEIHYIKEKERGVVWEECIIMAPKDVRMVFLSATVPNASEFAEWVCEITGAIVHVIYTEKRPTPLEHFLAVRGTGLTKILYEKEMYKSEDEWDENEKEESESEEEESDLQKGKRIKVSKSDKKNDDKTNKNNDAEKNNINKDNNLSDGSKNELIDLNNKNNLIKKNESDGFLNNKITKNTRVKCNFFDKKAFANCMKMINGKQRIDEDDVKSVVDNLIGQDCLPVIVFSFSRKECENYAMAIKQDFLKDEEKKTINLIYTNALMNLREEDRNLPLITNMLPMLLRGTGIHHSGLLPILKEIVEILFQEGLLKVLFATETFSIGLNMPARSVVFTNLTKFDGEERRILSSGEYIQMSGRAGRRGIDSKGMVVAMIGEVINIRKAENLFSGLADKLTSAFRLSYNMILNLMRVEGLDTLYLLERSYFHYQSKIGRGEMSDVITKMKKQIDLIYDNRKTIERNNATKEPFFYFDEDVLSIDKNNLNLFLILNKTNTEFRLHLLDDIRNLHPLQIYNFLIAYEKIRLRRNKEMYKLSKPYLEKGRVVNLFIPRRGSSIFLDYVMIQDITKKNVTIVTQIERSTIKKTFPIEYIDSIFDVRVKNLKGLEIMNRKGNKEITLEEMVDNYKQNKEEANSIKIEMEIYNDILYSLDQKMSCIRNRNCYFCENNSNNIDCITLRCFDDENLNNYFDKEYKKEKNDYKQNLRKIFMEENYIKKYEDNINFLKELNEIYHMEESKKMIQVLRRLEYCDENNVLTKGRVACEISTGDEILLTEMMFNGDFISLPVEEVVPLLSCIVYPEWDNESTISDTNSKNYNLLKTMLEKITTVMKNCGIEVEISSVLKRYSFELMDVVELWVRGFSFTEICNRTNVYEGTIIRCFRRLEELLKQMCSAARNIGNTDLENLFAMGISKIKRDIVFASSLYL